MAISWLLKDIYQLQSDGCLSIFKICKGVKPRAIKHMFQNGLKDLPILKLTETKIVYKWRQKVNHHLLAVKPHIVF